MQMKKGKKSTILENQFEKIIQVWFASDDVALQMYVTLRHIFQS